MVAVGDGSDVAVGAGVGGAAVFVGDGVAVGAAVAVAAAVADSQSVVVAVSFTADICVWGTGVSATGEGTAVSPLPPQLQTSKTPVSIKMKRRRPVGTLTPSCPPGESSTLATRTHPMSKSAVLLRKRRHRESYL
jgi:hypothetical protein